MNARPAPKILLAAAMDWPFPARLARGFAGLGARVEAVCPQTSPLRLSAAPVRLHPFSYLRPLASLARAVAAAEPDLVIPCDDLAAALLWRLGEKNREFSALLTRSSGTRDAFPVLAARNDFLQAAEAAGAPVAETIPVTTQLDLDRAIARLDLPLVLKADGSWGGDGVAIVRDRAAARAALESFASPSRLKSLLRAIKRREPHFLVRDGRPAVPGLGAQRFIPGHPATSTIACWKGQLLAANHFDVIISQGTGPATVIARTACGQMEDAAARIVSHFGLSGLYGLDYMRDAAGAVFLLEINPRATPTSHLALGPGHDLLAALLGAAGYPVPERPAITGNPRIALFPQELRRDPQSPHLASAYHDVPLDDPELAAALAGGPVRLTSFSRGISGISSPETLAGSGTR